jgi:pimeloyl-ACP methyl ester carboxylesterase
MTALAHRSAGEGAPLILLNGIAMSVASWEPMAPLLEDEYQVFRCDFRGQLLSKGPPHGDISRHADDVAALMDHLGLCSAHIVSTSFGGAVGAILAARHPHRVRSLVSVASAAGFDVVMAEEIRRWRAACERVVAGASGEELATTLEPVVYSAAFLDTHQQERMVARMAMAALPTRWFEDLIGLLDSVDSFVLADHLHRISCPTLIIAAGEDGFIPRQHCRALADGIPGARFEVIEGAGHAVVAEQPEEVVRLTKAFLATL